MKIYVGNMPFTMDEAQTRTLFSEFGEVDSVNVITDRMSGRPRGFAFVEMMTDEGASAAIRALDGQDMDGRTLKVSEAKPRAPRGGGGGHRGNRRY